MNDVSLLDDDGDGALESAAAFARSAALRPTHAYAHYNGGLMHYRASRPDIMRSVRGP